METNCTNKNLNTDGTETFDVKSETFPHSGMKRAKPSLAENAEIISRKGAKKANEHELLELDEWKFGTEGTEKLAVKPTGRNACPTVCSL